MEDHQNLEEFRTRGQAKSTEAGSGGYGIGEDFHDGEKDLLSSEVFLQPNANEMLPVKQDDGKEAESSLTMEDHQHLEKCSNNFEAKGTSTDGDTGSRGYGIREDFHDGEKDLLSSEVLFQPNANQMPKARPNDGKKGHVCAVCKQGFRKANDLLRHERSHSGEKPFSCSLCGRRFSQYGTLRRHELIHTGEKPFRCQICDVAFARSSNLRTHEKTHAGKKPFGCPVCNVSFSRSSHLRSHESTHPRETVSSFIVLFVVNNSRVPLVCAVMRGRILEGKPFVFLV
ncbi:unnamed protein product [Cyprideis torosa]|uniref:Uncharacterized protein n=1 Tax=Cyprideis torosa TaxID=163714 RepID=A0A7R8WLQ0_9CRUS|nr:unnamed protein product [Cyprideis torosa]CAG0901862.1 unnamed protein product [Cyprideis torosa]